MSDLGHTAWTPEMIAAVKATRGFAGDTCGKCGRAANVAAGPGVWFCPCGHHNIQTINSSRLHARPDFGPTPREIEAA